MHTEGMSNTKLLTAPPLKAAAAPPPVPSREDWLRIALEASNRKIAPIRHTFVQRPPGTKPRRGPLANFVERGDLSGLRAFLLAHALASAPPWAVDIPTEAWVKCLALDAGATSSSATSRFSKILSR